MELESIMGYLHKKTILITGATGLLGMVIVEKILRVQPEINKLYLLVRPSNNKSAKQRMNEEILDNELFKILREKWGVDFDSFISQKVNALPGDISSENLGLNKDKVELLCNEIQIIINSAANTNFDERYDISLGINTFGLLHMLNVTNKCIKLEMFVQISTVYSSKAKTGVILEDFPSMEENVTESKTLNLEVLENNLVKKKLNELRTQNVSEENITKTMKNFGIERAKLYGWSNTYAFTKAMGELILRRYIKKNLPFIIIRSPILTSTYKEPFPGWTQGYRTVDVFIAGYCTGKLTFLPVNPMTILELMPVDMVVNSIIAAMVVNANKFSTTIYNVGSSLRNSITCIEVSNFLFQYFTTSPRTNKNGKLITVRPMTIFKTMSTFHMYIRVRYMLPLKVLKVVNYLSCQYFKDVYDKNNKKLGLVMRMVELYRTYLFFSGRFDDTNSEKLRNFTSNCFVDAENFNFDPTFIDWEDYFIHTHIPGVVEHVLRND